MTDQAEQGTKVAGFYRLAELPAILIIDPFTGAKLRHWTGFVEAHRCARQRLCQERQPHAAPGFPHVRKGELANFVFGVAGRWWSLRWSPGQ